MKKDKNLDNKQMTFARRNFYTNDDSSKVYIFAILAPYIIAFVISLILAGIANAQGVTAQSLTTSTGYLIVASFVAPVCFLLIYFLYNKTFYISHKATTINKPIGSKNILIAVIVALVALFGSWMFFNLHDEFLFNILKYPQSIYPQGTLLGFPVDNAGWLILEVLLLGVLPAVCEELIFRGVILQGLRKNFADKTAILLSALMFTLMHASIQQFVYPFLLGLVLGWIAIRTGSLISSMLVHFINNTIVVVFGYLGVKYNFNFLGFTNEWWYYLVAIALIVVAGAVIYLIDKLYFKHKNQDQEFEKELVAKPSLFMYVGLALGVILLVISTITTYLS